MQIMDISFSKNSFEGVSLFIATPMYGGVCASNYLMGMVDLFAACTAYGIPLTLHGLANDSLIQRARNSCTNAFLRSDFTHLLFIDADVGFKAKDVLSLLYLMAQDNEKKYDVLAGSYPKKQIAWKKIKQAVEKGLGEENPDNLKYYGNDYTFLVPPGKKFTLKAPAEVSKIGTGFMMISRNILKKFIEHYPEELYKASDGKEEYAFFNCYIDPKTKWHWGEDFRFCHFVKEIGGKIWLAPWIQLSHQGTHSFYGSLSHMATLEKLKGNK
jgi:hypothetical protein